MAKIKCKGTVLQLDIATVYTAIAQIISIDGPEAEVETYDSTALDSGAGKEYDVTGYVEGGEVSGNLWFDPALASHQALTDLITTPAVSAWKLIWSDTTEWAFGGIFKGLGPSVDMSRGLQGAFKIKLDGIVTYPT